MRAYEEFCGVRIVTFCVLSNSFHIQAAFYLYSGLTGSSTAPALSGKAA
jgi:hypothetical protein